MSIAREIVQNQPLRSLVKPVAYAFTFILSVVTAWEAKAQSNVHLSTYIDVGENNVSEGFYLKTAILGTYQWGKYFLNAGSQFNLIYSGSKVFTGSKIIGGREFSIKNFDFEIHGLFMYNSISENIFETNWGVLATIDRKHFHYQLGTNFRTYQATKNARKEFDPDSDYKIHENWNLMYLIGYNLKPDDHNWNVGITITNIDHFLISQETNPMIRLHGSYQISDPILLYAESWYKSAGAFNISVNYFGFFFRTGLIWKIDLAKK